MIRTIIISYSSTTKVRQKARLFRGGKGLQVWHHRVRQEQAVPPQDLWISHHGPPGSHAADDGRVGACAARGDTSVNGGFGQAHLRNMK